MFGSDKNFKMPKTIKRLMSSLGGKKRIVFKHMMIKAVMTAVKAPPKKAFKNKKKSDKE